MPDRWAPSPRPGPTQGIPGIRGSSARFCAAAGDSGTMRGPVLESRSGTWSASSRTSSQRSARISLRRQPVSAAGGSPPPRGPRCRRRPRACPAPRRDDGASVTRHAGGSLERPNRGGDLIADGCGSVAQPAREVRHMPPPDRKARRPEDTMLLLQICNARQLFAPTLNRDRSVNSIQPSYARSGPFDVGKPRPGIEPEDGHPVRVCAPDHPPGARDRSRHRRSPRSVCPQIRADAGRHAGSRFLHRIAREMGVAGRGLDLGVA